MSVCVESVYSLVTQLCNVNFAGFEKHLNNGRTLKTARINKAVKAARNKAFTVLFSSCGDAKHQTLGLSNIDFLISKAYHLRCSRHFTDAEKLESLAIEILNNQNHGVSSVLRLLACLSDSVEPNKQIPCNEILMATARTLRIHSGILPEGPRSYGEDMFPRSKFYYTNYPQSIFENMSVADPFTFSPNVNTQTSCWLPSKLSSDPSRWFTDAFSRTEHNLPSLELCYLLPPSSCDSSVTPNSSTATKFDKRPPSEEDEGFAENYTPSNSATPLSGSFNINGESLELDVYSENGDLWEKAMLIDYPIYRTWEACGRVYAEKEKPLLSESGPQSVDETVLTKLSALVIFNPELRIPMLIKVRLGDLVRDLKLLMIGVKSRSFVFNKLTCIFDIRQGVYISGLSPEAVESLVAPFIECGSFAAALSTYFSRWKSNQSSKFIIFDAFLCGVSTWFQHYVTHILEINSVATLLELNLRTAKLRKWIPYLGEMCATVIQLIKKPPAGISILSFIYNALLENVDPDLNPLVMSLFITCCKPFLKYIHKWIFEGECIDCYGEFGVAIDNESLQHRDRRFWTKAYQFKTNDCKDSFPAFLDCIAGDILSCGKTLNLLRVCSAEHPLTRIETTAPDLNIIFTKLELEDIETQWDVYFDEMKRQLYEHCTPYKQKLLQRERDALITLQIAEKTRSDWMAELERKNEEKRRARDKLKQRNLAELKAQINADRERKKMKYEQKLTAVAIPNVLADTCEIVQMEQSPDSPDGDQPSAEVSITSEEIMDNECVNSCGTSDAEQAINNRNECDEIANSEITNYYNLNQLGAVAIDPNANVDRTSDLGNDNANFLNENLNLLNFSGRASPTNSTTKGSKKREKKNKVKRKADQMCQQEEFVNNQKVPPTNDCSPIGSSALDANDGHVGDNCGDIFDCNSKVMLRLRGRNIHGHASDSSIETLLYAKSSQSSCEPSHPCVSNTAPKGAGIPESADVKTNAGNEFAAMPYKQYLTEFGSLDGIFKKSIVPSGHDNADKDLITLPIKIILERCLLNPLGYQIFLVNSGIVDYFMVEENLNAHFNALRDYFFFQDGEFGQSLCDLLFEKLMSCRHPAQLLNPVTLNFILSQAVSLSINGETEYSGHLSLVVKHTPVAFPANDITTLDCLGLSYKPNWPINVVITQSCLEKYNNIFNFMLQVKMSCWSLTNIFHTLKSIENKFHIKASFHYRQLQIFRHSMHHFVRVLQDYICSQVLQVTWQEFTKELSGSVRNLDDLYGIHANYLNKVCFRCLLNKKAARVVKIIHDCLNAILRFDAQLKVSEWMVNINTSEVETLSYSRLLATYKAFKESTEFLYMVMEKLQGKGYLQLLEEFLLKLDLNKTYFYGSCNQTV